MNIKKGDQVKIISGKDKGKIGKVIKVFPEENKLTVEEVNLYKKRIRPTRAGQKGEIVLVARPLNASKVMLVCQNCKKTTRPSYRFLGSRKIRYCKRCGEIS